MQWYVLLVLPSEVLSRVRDATNDILENSFEENGEEVVELKIVLILFAVVVVGIVLQQVTARRRLILEYLPLDELLDDAR